MEVSRSVAELAQGHLQPLTVGHGAGREQLVHGEIRGEEREAVDQLEAPLGQALPLA